MTCLSLAHELLLGSSKTSMVSLRKMKETLFYQLKVFHWWYQDHLAICMKHIKRRNLQYMTHSECHSILYTNRNYMGAPKNYKGLKTTPRLSTVQFLLFLYFQMTHIRVRGVTFQALCLLLLVPLFQLNINSFTYLSIAQRHTKPSEDEGNPQINCYKVRKFGKT